MCCSNPEAFGVEGTDKDPIFGSLNNITQLPPVRRKMMIDWTILLFGQQSPAIVEGEGKNSPVAGAGE